MNFYVAADTCVFRRRSNDKQKASQRTYSQVCLVNFAIIPHLETYFLVSRIFSYLDVVTLCRCAQVSKLWNELALDGMNWQRIDLFDFQTDVEVSVKFHFITCLQFLFINLNVGHSR